MTKRQFRIILVLLCVFLFTGCTKQLKDENNKAVVNEETGQNLTENILCRPNDENTIKLYEEQGVKLEQ